MEWPLLSSITPAQHDALVALAHHRTFSRGEIVFREDEPGDSLHLLISGHLAVTTLTPDGDSALLNVLGPGDTFGELGLLDDGRSRSATVTALDAAQTRVLTRVDVERLCVEYPEVHRWLAVLLGKRVRELSERVRDLMFVPLDRRLHRALVELAATYGDASRPAAPVVVPLTQEELADFVGGTRPSVNKALGTLVAEGLVSVGRGRVTVLDRVALEGLAHS